MYPIINYKRIRKRTDYIILTHSRNLIEKLYIDPVVYKNNKQFTWGIWQRYFMEDLKKPALPCHHFVEFLDRDYVIYNGLYDFQPSYYMEDLVSAGIIDYKYINSILVVIQDDFSINTLERRLSEHLSDKLLTGMLRQYELDFTRIKYLDDCLQENWEENLKFSTLNYQYTKSKFFDFNTLKQDLDKYKKK